MASVGLTGIEIKMTIKYIICGVKFAVGPQPPALTYAGWYSECAGPGPAVLPVPLFIFLVLQPASRSRTPSPRAASARCGWLAREWDPPWPGDRTRSAGSAPRCGYYYWAGTHGGGGWAATCWPTSSPARAIAPWTSTCTGFSRAGTIVISGSSAKICSNNLT